MIKTQCPICQQAMRGGLRTEFPFFPFCSKRCRLIDLGRWLREDYRLAANPTDEQEMDSGEQEDL